jgi:hypothetical protein
METAAVVAVRCVLTRASAGRAATGGLMVMESAGADDPVGLWAERGCAFSIGPASDGDTSASDAPLGPRGGAYSQANPRLENRIYEYAS